MVGKEMRMRKSLLAVLFLAFCSPLVAQQSLNNDGVIKLVKAGLSDDLVISTINSQAGTYDTSPDGLIGLKKANVSDAVVAAILKKASGTDQAAPVPDASSAAPASTPEPSAAPPATAKPAGKPRVYISSASKGSNRNADRDQSMEVAKDFEKGCPDVRITISQNAADYTILLNHIEHGLLVRDNQIQVANKDGDLISTTKEGGSIKGDAKKACELILADWAKK